MLEMSDEFQYGMIFMDDILVTPIKPYSKMVTLPFLKKYCTIPTFNFIPMWIISKSGLN
jgi:hypothetical protein